MAVRLASIVSTNWTHSDWLSACETRSPATSTKSIGRGRRAPGEPAWVMLSSTCWKRAHCSGVSGCESLIWTKVKRGSCAPAGAAPAEEEGEEEREGRQSACPRESKRQRGHAHFDSSARDALRRSPPLTGASHPSSNPAWQPTTEPAAGEQQLCWAVKFFARSRSVIDPWASGSPPTRGHPAEWRSGGREKARALGSRMAPPCEWPMPRRR